MILADFLLARIVEDEADARAADHCNRWRVDKGGCCVVVADEDKILTEHGYTGTNRAPHIARWDPERVLAECAAKRRIVGLHLPVEFDAMGADDEERSGLRCTECWDNGTVWYVHWPCRTLRLLVLPYADHPDYRQEWTA